MPTTDSEDKLAYDNITAAVIWICLASAGIFMIGGAVWPSAVAVCGLSFMGVGIALLILKRKGRPTTE